jgi:hypothetical protein
MAFGPVSLQVTASATNSLLSFSAYNVSDFYTLDNVSVSVVPEPSTTALLMLGLLAAGLRGRRVRRDHAHVD